MSAQPSSGNVFRDLDLPNPEARLAKATAASRVASSIADRKWSHERAARFLGITPAQVRQIVRGNLSRWSISRLEQFANGLEGP